MNIPKELTIGGLKFTVVFDDEECIKNNMFGEVNSFTHTIVLSKTSKHGKVPDELIEQTYLHEVVHAVLEIMQETELNGNEKFVNTFSTFLHQIIKQLK